MLGKHRGEKKSLVMIPPYRTGVEFTFCRMFTIREWQEFVTGVSSRTGGFITSAELQEIKPCGIESSLTKQLALLELLVQQRTDLAVLSALVKLLLHLLRPLLVQNVLLFRGLTGHSTTYSHHLMHHSAQISDSNTRSCVKKSDCNV